MKSFRLAVAVQNAIPCDTGINLEACCAKAQEAADLGASMVVFPEMNITGYSSKEFIAACAESIPGPSTERLAVISRESGITILAGLAEISGNSYYASHVVITPEGLVSTYRKLHISPPERELFMPGNRIETFLTETARFGIQLCYDAHYPELSTRMALDGADILFFPHASPRGTPQDKFHSWMRHLTARAYDNGVYVVACNQVGENGLGLDFPGVALVIGPDGNLIDSYTGNEEHLLIVDLDDSLLSRVRNHRMRYFLPNRRDDLY